MIDVLPKRKQKYVFESILTNVGLFFFIFARKACEPFDNVFFLVLRCFYGTNL